MKHFQDADVEPGEMARWQGTGAVAAAIAAGPMPHLQPAPAAKPATVRETLNAIRTQLENACAAIETELQAIERALGLDVG